MRFPSAVPVRTQLLNSAMNGGEQNLPVINGV